MRLGGSIFTEHLTPERWVATLRASGYSAAYCPVGAEADRATIEAYAQAASDADIAIAEVGAWSNPMSADPAEAQAAMEKCQTQLALADEIGARCCVNISGSRGQPWDGPHPDNLTSETFAMVVEITRAIIDAVKPRRTFYTLEPMPWMFPDTANSYLALLKAVDRDAFGAHIDMVNVINSPHAYFGNSDLIGEWFAKLGPHIRSCHAKDTLLSTKLTTHLDEVRPGRGNLDYRRLLRELDKLDRDTPLMIEHLSKEEDFRLSAEYIRGVASEIGLRFI
ncbi:MAG: sugar phosphate isomerase/epimerase [Anaerolineae bacterium]|nr:sugar phosphate isomerase/epimerase [Anaerolineae bacterium]